MDGMRYYNQNGESLELEEWARWFEDFDSRVLARDERDGVAVSTVWLGIDHNFIEDGPPLIFETMIFGGDHDQEQWRYATKEQAQVGHARACALAFGGGGGSDEQ